MKFNILFLIFLPCLHCHFDLFDYLDIPEYFKSEAWFSIQRFYSLPYVTNPECVLTRDSEVKLEEAGGEYCKYEHFGTGLYVFAWHCYRQCTKKCGIALRTVQCDNMSPGYSPVVVSLNCQCFNEKKEKCGTISDTIQEAMNEFDLKKCHKHEIDLHSINPVPQLKGVCARTTPDPLKTKYEHRVLCNSLNVGDSCDTLQFMIDKGITGMKCSPVEPTQNYCNCKAAVDGCNSISCAAVPNICQIYIESSTCVANSCTGCSPPSLDQHCETTNLNDVLGKVCIPTTDCAPIILSGRDCVPAQVDSKVCTC